MVTDDGALLCAGYNGVIDIRNGVGRIASLDVSFFNWGVAKR